ncbi:MAG: DUF6069 family protein [Gemmatimonadota bacterium]|jgi:hypothetical protein
MQRTSLWVSGLKAVAGALVATSAVRAVAVTLLDIPPDFQPLDGPGPVVFFTGISAVVAVGVYAMVRRVALDPDFAFRWVAGVVLVLSVMPDLWLLSDSAEDAFPGATPTAVLVLIVLHIAAAVPIVWFLTTGGPGRADETSGEIPSG